jgi:hypothetical protein
MDEFNSSTFELAGLAASNSVVCRFPVVLTSFNLESDWLC